MAAEFREIRERLDAVERGDKSLTYRQMMTTNDASNARSVYSERTGNGQYVPKDNEVYAAALVNPKYPVLVARFHVIVIGGGGACDIYLRASLSGNSRETRRWSLTGNPDGGFRHHTFEIAWLHGMPVDQWDETEAQTRVRRGNVEIHVNVTGTRFFRDRNEDFDADARSKGFTSAQSEFMQAWFDQSEKRYPVFFREPEYVFLAPSTAFPTATLEGTLITGSNVPGYPVQSAEQTLMSAPPLPTVGVWPDVEGTWPMPRRGADG